MLDGFDLIAGLRALRERQEQNQERREDDPREVTTESGTPARRSLPHPDGESSQEAKMENGDTPGAPLIPWDGGGDCNSYRGPRGSGRDPAVAVPLSSWQPEAPPAGAVGTSTTVPPPPPQAECPECGGKGGWWRPYKSDAKEWIQCGNVAGHISTGRAPAPEREEGETCSSESGAGVQSYFPSAPPAGMTGTATGNPPSPAGAGASAQPAAADRDLAREIVERMVVGGSGHDVAGKVRVDKLPVHVSNYEGWPIVAEAMMRSAVLSVARECVKAETADMRKELETCIQIQAERIRYISNPASTACIREIEERGAHFGREAAQEEITALKRRAEAAESRAQAAEAEVARLRDELNQPVYESEWQSQQKGLTGLKASVADTNVLIAQMAGTESRLRKALELLIWKHEVQCHAAVSRFVVDIARAALAGKKGTE